MRTNILLQPSLKINRSEPDTTGILHDNQLADLGLIKISLFKIKDAINAVNIMVIDNGLSIRHIPDNAIDLAHNDISIIAYAHEQAEKRIRDAAFLAVELEAA